MPPRPGRSGKQPAPIAIASPMTRENLPAPLVYYPGRQGTFFGFATTRDEFPVLCSCAEEPYQHLIRLAAPEDGRLPPLDYAHFPDPVASAMLKGVPPTFRPGLCHRCNRVPPSLRYCHEAEGPRFVQTYGWYINQTYLRLGIHPTGERYLPDVCPPEYHDVLHRIGALQAQARAVRATLAALMNEARREIPRSERSHWPNATKAEVAPLEEIEHQLGRPKRQLGNAVQNITRAEFGARAVGEGWVRETELYRIVCRFFPGEEVRFHYRPDWMEGLELDVCVPGRRLALEHQGQQHFQPIQAWGGEAALLQVQARDARKAQLCAQAAIHLLIIHHDEPMTDEHIRNRIHAATGSHTPSS